MTASLEPPLAFRQFTESVAQRRAARQCVTELCDGGYALPKWRTAQEQVGNLATNKGKAVQGALL